MTEQSPIFAKTYDLMVWLIPLVTGFPKDQRFRLAARIEDSLFAFQEHLLRTTRVRERDRRGQLLAADLELEKLRLYLRLAQELNCVSFKQYEQSTRLCAEAGRLLGGWLKTLAAAPSA